MMYKKPKCYNQNKNLVFTLFAHISPQALHKVLGPSGPRRIIGVDFSLMPQWRQLNIFKGALKLIQTSLLDQ